MTNIETAARLARDLLKKYKNNLDVAFPHFAAMLRKKALVDDVLRDFLQRTVNSSAKDQMPQGQNAGADDESPADRSMPQGPTTVAGLSLTAKIKVSAHEVPAHKRRTPEQKAAFEKAMAARAEAIFDMRVNGSKLGDLRLGYLKTLARDLRVKAGSGLQQGIEDTKQALLIQMLADFGTPIDTNATVRDSIPIAKLHEMNERAKELTPRVISLGITKYAEVLESGQQMLGDAP
jgi:hypothetical protein